MNQKGGWLIGIPILISAILIIYVMRPLWNSAILDVIRPFIGSDSFTYIVLEAGFYLFGIALIYGAWRVIQGNDQQ